MKKEKVKIEQILAGALLKFGKLESADISLIMYELKDLIEIEMDDEDNLGKYMVMSDGGILLNEKFIHSFYNQMYGTLFGLVEGTVIKDYFEKLDIYNYVLKKINMIGLGFVVKDGLRDIFSKKQIEAINYLYSEGLIEDYIQEDALYSDYEAIRLTQSGNYLLFSLKNSEKLNCFFEILEEMGYDYEIINNYLLNQDFLHSSCGEILSFSNFNNYILNCRKVISRKK